MSKLIFETWPIEKLIDYVNNPRKNDHAVDKIAAAMREFGFRCPIIVKSDGLVVDGHLRLKAAKKLGLIEVPVILADDMTDLQIKAFRLSVNKMAELADWDNELLSIELEFLKDEGFDLDLLGFDDASLELPDYSDKNKELDADDFSDDVMELKLKFSQEQYEFIIEKLRKINSSHEMALLQAFNYEL